MTTKARQRAAKWELYEAMRRPYTPHENDANAMLRYMRTRSFVSRREYLLRLAYA